jgi:hypothetical protein
MRAFTNQEIKEIAQQLEGGFRCFYHLETRALLFVPDELKHYGMDLDAWADELEKLEEDFTSYKEIEALDSRESFQIMADFAEGLKGANRLQERLIDALNKKHPFRNFKYIIDNSGDYRDRWFEYKDARLIELVKERLESDAG